MVVPAPVLTSIAVPLTYTPKYWFATPGVPYATIGMSVAEVVLNQASTLRLANPVGTPAPDVSWTEPAVPSSVIAVLASLTIAPATPSVTPDAEYVPLLPLPLESV